MQLKWFWFRPYGNRPVLFLFFFIFTTTTFYYIIFNKTISKSWRKSIDKDLEQTIFWLNAFDDIIYKIYQLNDETIIIITDNVISKENIEHLKESLDDSYIVLINCGTDLNTSMDLKKISNYLYSTGKIHLSRICRLFK